MTRLAFALVLAACGSPPPVAARESAAAGVRVWQRPIAVDGGPGRLIVAEFAPGADIEVLPSSVPVQLERIAGPLADRACVAINGGFYDDTGAMGLVVHAGAETAALRKNGGSGVLLVDAAGPRIVHRDLALGSPREALQSIDRLVDGGRSLVGPAARPDPDARSAVALRDDGTLVLAVVFAEQAVVREQPGRLELGSASSSTGLGLAAWADLLARPLADGGLAATTALNLDGGYSTAISIHAAGLDLEVVAHVATINAVRVCTGTS
ncbi:MAG: phosphodiester glycosidase family protein [Myxococcales bacterium]|nr:phosphodiester glycosidase family protein [Myxococcales bacterium]